MTVIGVDAYRDRWVAATLDERSIVRVEIVRSSGELSSRDAVWIAVDVPIGLVESGRRAADQAARAALGPRIGSVFLTPPRPVLEAPTYAEAVVRCRELTNGVGLSRQAFGLFPKILEAERVRQHDPRFVEVHPELSFAAMNGGHPCRWPRRSWNGQVERRRLLAQQGIDLPGVLPDEVGIVPVDDVLDAIAAAWTARRLATGQAISTPSGAVHPGETGYIWS